MICLSVINGQSMSRPMQINGTEIMEFIASLALLDSHVFEDDSEPVIYLFATFLPFPFRFCATT